MKGNFVKLHDEQVTHGMRFTKPSIAQEVCTIQFLEISKRLDGFFSCLILHALSICLGEIRSWNVRMAANVSLSSVVIFSFRCSTI